MRSMIRHRFAGFIFAMLLMGLLVWPAAGKNAGQVQAARHTVLSARVNSAVMKIRPGKGSSFKALKTLHYNDRVKVLTTGTKWVRVRSGNVTGYAKGKLLTTALGGTASDEGGCGKGQQVANFALQFVGNPYVWGGTSLTHGADCSGFVMSVYKHFGKKLPHSSAAQRRYGKKVRSLKEARAGDVICYSGHVAIYLGNRRIVHASSRKTGIKVSPDAAYRRIVSIRRMF